MNETDQLHQISWAMGDHDLGPVRYTKLHLMADDSHKTLCGLVIPEMPDNFFSDGRCKKCESISRRKFSR